MLLDYRPIVMQAEQEAAGGDVVATLRQLRRLALRDFGDLMWQLPHPELPRLNQLLPRMASADIQVAWTGASGGQIMLASVDFVRILQTQFERITHRPLHRARIMDYGCGYGRLGRLMYWYTDPENYFGIDPWDRSIEICRDCAMLGNILQSDYLPATLPVGGRLFDLIFSYSVFTHTSPRATRAALTALRTSIHSSGLLVITTRPADFWRTVTRLSAEQQDALIATQQRDGFAYLPGQFPIVDGDAVFGDTTMNPAWIERNFPFWRVLTYERGQDSWQNILVLAPV